MRGAVPAVLLAAAFLAGAAAPARVAPASMAFPSGSTVLAEVAKRAEVRLAVAEDAPPFAWTGKDGKPAGYAVEACRAIAADVAASVGLTLADAPRAHAVTLRFVPMPVSAEAAAVADGTVDLGCSGVPPGRAGTVADSPPLAWSGVRLLTARLGPVSSVRDLAGGTVAVVAGSAAADTLAGIAPTLSPPARVVPVPSPGDGYELVATGAADAFAADDLLLAGLLATRTDGPSFEVVGRELARGPLAVLFRAGDPAFAALVRRTLDRMRADGTLRAAYGRWFTEPLPDGAAPDRPPSRDTEAVLGPGPPPAR